MPSVKVYSAGTHWHSEPKETTDLLTLLITKAGYTKNNLEWECRIDKMKHCSTNSPPVRVVSWKRYGVSLRVKPETNGNVDHLMTLMVPTGSDYSAEDIFKQLKGAEKSISRQWRQIEKEKGKIPVPTIPSELIERELPEIPTIEEPKVMPPVVSQNDRPEFKSLKAIDRSQKKLKYVLQRVNKINDLNIHRSKQDFIAALMFECKWDDEGHLPRICSRVLTELIKSEYIMAVYEGVRIVSYCLDRKGKEVVGDDVKVKEPEVATKLETSDFVDLISNSRDKLQELANVGARLAANKRKREELQEYIKKIDEENTELIKVLEQSNESFDHLFGLERLIMPLPSLVSNPLPSLVSEPLTSLESTQPNPFPERQNNEREANI